MIDNKQYKILHEILSFTRASNTEAKIMLDFIQNNIDESAHICLHCGAQIKLAHTRIKKWYEMNKSEIENREIDNREIENREIDNPVIKILKDIKSTPTTKKTPGRKKLK